MVVSILTNQLFFSWKFAGVNIVYSYLYTQLESSNELHGVVPVFVLIKSLNQVLANSMHTHYLFSAMHILCLAQRLPDHLLQLHRYRFASFYTFALYLTSPQPGIIILKGSPQISCCNLHELSKKYIYFVYLNGVSFVSGDV